MSWPTCRRIRAGDPGRGLPDPADRAAAEDVMVDTLMAALDRGSQSRDPNALRAWLLRIATNQALGSRRKGARVDPSPRPARSTRSHGRPGCRRSRRSLGRRERPAAPDASGRRPALLRGPSGRWRGDGHGHQSEHREDPARRRRSSIFEPRSASARRPRGRSDMREFDDARLERLLRDTLHAEADALPLEVDADSLIERWRSACPRSIASVGRSRCSAWRPRCCSRSPCSPRAVVGRRSSRPSPSPSGSPSRRAASIPPPTRAGSPIARVAAPERVVRLVHPDGTGDHGIQVPPTEPWDEAEWSTDGTMLLLARVPGPGGVLDILEYDLATGTDPRARPLRPGVLAGQRGLLLPGRWTDRLLLRRRSADDAQRIPPGLRDPGPADRDRRVRHADPPRLWPVRGPTSALVPRRQRCVPPHAADTKGGPVTGSALFVRDLASGGDAADHWDASREELDWSPDGDGSRSWTASRAIRRPADSRGSGRTGPASRSSTRSDRRRAVPPRYTADGAWILVSDLRGGGRRSSADHLRPMAATRDEFLRRSRQPVHLRGFAPRP